MTPECLKYVWLNFWCCRKLASQSSIGQLFFHPWISVCFMVTGAGTLSCWNISQDGDHMKPSGMHTRLPPNPGSIDSWPSFSLGPDWSETQKPLLSLYDASSSCAWMTFVLFFSNDLSGTIVSHLPVMFFFLDTACNCFDSIGLFRMHALLDAPDVGRASRSASIAEAPLSVIRSWRFLFHNSHNLIVKFCRPSAAVRFVFWSIFVTHMPGIESRLSCFWMLLWVFANWVLLQTHILSSFESYCILAWSLLENHKSCGKILTKPIDSLHRPVTRVFCKFSLWTIRTKHFHSALFQLRSTQAIMEPICHGKRFGLSKTTPMSFLTASSTSMVMILCNSHLFLGLHRNPLSASKPWLARWEWTYEIIIIVIIIIIINLSPSLKTHHTFLRLHFRRRW